jgi:glycosyltransferase involved in cell wall biosynthesis
VPNNFLSACVPCYNNEATLAATLDSIRSQTAAVDDLVVVDDGSSDRSAAVALACGARVVQHAANLGRGAARARGLVEARHPLMLFVDATAVLPGDFIAGMLPWFEDVRVAAVCARIDDPQPDGVVRRWRARHLFRVGADVTVARHASLITGGSMLRRESVLEVGNFNPALRHGEDADLGRRLLAGGFDVVFDPRQRVSSTGRNSLAQVLERYSRWNGTGETISWSQYLQGVAYSVKVLAREDLAANDPAAVPISLVAPHYQAWKTLRRRAARSAGSS